MQEIILLASLLLCLGCSATGSAQNVPAASSSQIEKARVFITDSQSWEMRGSGGGSNGAWGAHSSGGARPQTAEIIKTFGERCPAVMVNNIQSKADYIIVLDHEGGKGWLQHKNKVAVFERISGDSIVSKSTLSLGGSVQEACDAIAQRWPTDQNRLRAAADAETGVKQPPAISTSSDTKNSTPKLVVASTPDGADIEVDGNFMGNTPSAIELAPGDHNVVVRKSGFKAWQRKLRLGGGDIRLNAELEKELAG